MQIFRGGARKAQQAHASRIERRPSVLVIDENPTARAVLARRLSHLGYDVALAENGFAALGLLVTRPVDIILIDMGLAQLSAVATMEKIRASGFSPHASFVTIAGRLERALAVEALKAGADAHIAKPLDFDLLDARLRHLCVRAERMEALSRHNAELDARIARRALELGETREALHEMQTDRLRLVSSIQALQDEIARLSAARA
ncbi:Response regulator receiver domain-containing protein [Sphingobium faniae]|nr:Response regulator receiver domain-containing protein [Sphingobium faniae]